jgi:hypothetical protein
MLDRQRNPCGGCGAREQDEALTNAINDCLQPFVTKGEEYIHGWHCIKVQRRAHSSLDEHRLTACLACSSFGDL